MMPLIGEKKKDFNFHVLTTAVKGLTRTIFYFQTNAQIFLLEFSLTTKESLLRTETLFLAKCE